MKNKSILEALSTRRMFIVHRLVPLPDGKLDKIPTNPLDGSNSDAQNSLTWLTPDEALMWADMWNMNPQPGVIGYGVGLVISEGCGVAAIDLDHALGENGGWLPHVLAFEARFPEAAKETSASGTGRHIFVGYTGTIPPHGTRNRDYRMEAYSARRFMALTGEGASGSVLVDYGDKLRAFLAEFFPLRSDRDASEWTSTPVPEWRGPADDDELIARAMRSHSMRAVFGGAASFGALWTADAHALANAFPPQSAHQTYDGSGADQALANHLAFWTGNDCARIHRLMLRSALVRPKWERFDNYLAPTILRACADQTQWYAERESPGTAGPTPDPVAAGVPASTAGGPSVAPPPLESLTATIQPVPTGAALPAHMTAEPPAYKPGQVPAADVKYISTLMMMQIFEGFTYVEDVHRIQFPDGHALTKERFDAIFGGPEYAMTPDGQKPTKSAWDAFVLSEITRFPRVATQYFRPDELTGAIRVRDGRREINCYVPARVPHKSGDVRPFLDLVSRMLPYGNDAQILIAYMAACVRHLGKKFGWCVFLQGAKGNGKTTVARILQYCISRKYTHWAKAKELGEKFNSVFVEKLLVIIDEMYSDDRNELQEILKIMVTSDQMEVRPMYAEKMMRDICFNMMLISNHQNAVRIDASERRYAPLFCAQQSKDDIYRDGMDADYFIVLNAWLEADGFAIIHDYLLNVVEIPDDLNPATRCIRAPETSSTNLATTASLGGVEQELMEAVEQQADGFRNGWISSHAVDLLLARIGKDKGIPRAMRKQLVLGLGYVPHPALKDGLCTVPMTDGNMPRLYVTKGHAWAVDYLTAQQVRDGFIEAQRRR